MDIERARFNMIEQQIRPWDVLNKDVLDLLSAVKREDFVPPAYRAMAFADTEIPLNLDGRVTGQTMFSPKMEARLLQAVAPRRHEHAIEIGAGSGYMAALLAHRVRQITTLEIDADLAAFASRNLRDACIHNATVEQRDGADPVKAVGETGFDLIVLSGSVAFVPQPWLDRLNIGGRLVAIVGELPVMTAQLVTRQSASQCSTQILFDTVAPRLIGFPEKSHFQF